jgi:lipopolysaccharide biosynthesis glycosyltransferase
MNYGNLFKNNIQQIFHNLNINGKIWCLNLKTKFEAAYSRLKIFDYMNIKLYDKILYLDCDILITNSINKVLDFPLENKLYALQSGNTNHVWWGKQFFNNNNPNCIAFTSGILLFNNNIKIKNLFSQILSHISSHIANNLPIPVCFDQPFIVYHAFKNNLYDNQKLINLVIDNPKKFNGETISHFPGGVGHYESKIVKMNNFMNNVMFNVKNKEVMSEIILNKFINKKYKWKNSSITFLENGKAIEEIGIGKYNLIDKYIVKYDFNESEYLFKFNQDYSEYICIKKQKKKKQKRRFRFFYY